MIDPRLLQLSMPASTPNETFKITAPSHNEGGMSVPMEQRIHGIPACRRNNGMHTPAATPSRNDESSPAVPIEPRTENVPVTPAKRSPPATPTGPAKKVKTEPPTPRSPDPGPPATDPFGAAPGPYGLAPNDDPAAWTPREYAALASECYSAFPLAAFAASYGKSRAAVAEAFHALVLLPLLDQTRPPGTPALLGGAAAPPAAAPTEPYFARPAPAALAAGPARVLTQRALQRECAATLAHEARGAARAVPDARRAAEDALLERLVRDGVVSRAWVECAKRERDGGGSDDAKKDGSARGTGKKAAPVRTVAEATEWVAEASEALTKARRAEERRAKNAKRDEGGKGKGRKEKGKDL